MSLTPPRSPRDRYINRELSWLRFNERVLAQAADPRHPLLERVRFLAIFSNNLNEFFMVRVGGLTALRSERMERLSIDGRLPSEQLHVIRERLVPTLQERTRLWQEDLKPALEAEGISIHPYSGLTEEDREPMRQLFEHDIFPVLTPLAVDPGHPFPHISNLSLNLAIEVELSPGNVRFARLKIPATVPRLLRLPRSHNPGSHTRHRFVWVEELVAANLDVLFPGVRVRAAYPFRLVRDADQPLVEAEVSDLMLAMENHLRRRYFGRVVRLEVAETMPDATCEMLLANLELDSRTLARMPMPLDYTALFDLVSQVARPDLKYPPIQPARPSFFRIEKGESFFARLRQEDRLLHHPYDSFEPMIDFVERAARDAKVVAIKQTLYRVGNNSPIVEALLEARRMGKQVAVLVELKARFDEESNIEWARTLEEEGVHVVYGLLGLKTHSKVTLVVRREGEVLRRYAHVGTGNYNAGTAKLYTDLSLFTARPEVGRDISKLFNFLTGFATQHDYETLLVAPVGLREGIVQRIEREIAHAQAGRPAHLFFKMNSLTDRAMIDAFYRASAAGVVVQLIVRGACCLRPGVPGLSQNIEVRSVIGRFLEHSRIFYFANGGEAEVLIGSADLMGRNLDRRVEVVLCIAHSPHCDELLHVLCGTWQDSCNNYRLCADGHYESLRDRRHPLDVHRYLLTRHNSLSRD